MIRLSARYAVPVLVLALLAGVPVYVHTTGILDRDDCAHPGALRATLLIEGSRPLSREEQDEEPEHPELLLRTLGTVPWNGAKTGPLRFALVRDWDPNRIALHPHGYVTEDFETVERELEWREREGQRLPVHWLLDRSRSHPRFAAFVFVYGSRPRESPFPTLLRSAPSRLFLGARPLTLLAVGGEAPEPRLPQARRRAEDWLFAAWRYYRTVCTGTPEAD